MSPVKRLLRRIPFLRWCAMQHAQQLRQRQRDASWAYVQSVLTTLGNITISWAGIELMLIHLVLWHHAKNSVRPERGLPRMLSLQLDYVKRSIETDTALSSETRAKLTDIRRRIASLNEFRINVTHGIVHQKNSRTTDWHTYSIKIEGMGWREIKRSYSNEEIQDRSRAIHQLGHEMSPFFALITGMPHPANSR